MLSSSTFEWGVRLMGKCTSSDLELSGAWDDVADVGFSAATARILAYFTDECARDLGGLRMHFTDDCEIITPDGVYSGHTAVAELYQKSFESFPGLAVHVKASFQGRGENCFEYRAELTDVDNKLWLIEGINLMRLERGLIASLRSFEDVPRLLAVEGQANQWNIAMAN
jgi:SnoaL-like domain